MEVQLHSLLKPALDSGVPMNFVRGGGSGCQQIQLRTEDSENWDLVLEAAVIWYKKFNCI